MRRAVLVLILLPLMVALGLTVVPVRAEEPYDGDFYGSWQCDYDMTTATGTGGDNSAADNGWGYASQWNNNDGMGARLEQGSGFGRYDTSGFQINARSISIRKFFNGPGHLYEIQVHTLNDRHGFLRYRVRDAALALTWEETESRDTENYTNTPTFNTITLNQPYDDGHGVGVAVWRNSEQSHWGMDTQRITFVRLRGFGTPPCSDPTAWSADYTEPLTEYGATGFIENEAGTSSTTNALLGFSPLPGGKVSAGQSGTVTQIINASQIPGWNQINIPAGDGSAWGMRYRTSINGLSEAWLVTITPDDPEEQPLHYLVSNPHRFVEVGSVVAPGCWIGETARLEPLPPHLLDQMAAGITSWLNQTSSNITDILECAATGDAAACSRAGYGAGGSGGGGRGFLPYHPILDQGVVAVWAGNYEADQLINFTLTAPAENQCAIPGEYESCIGDAMFEHPTDWAAQGGVYWLGRGVSLDPGASISRKLSLDPDKEPQVDVLASSWGQSQLRIELGSASRTVALSGPPREHRLVAGDQADTGETHQYTLRLTNTGSDIIDADYACVNYATRPVDPEDPDGDWEPWEPGPSEPFPGGDRVCYFVNHAFSDGTFGWVVDNVRLGTGQIMGTPNTQFGQLVHLGEGTYTIRATVAPWGDNPGGDFELGLEYVFPAGESWSQVGSETLDTFLDRGGVLDFTQVFNISGGAINGYFTMRPTEAGSRPASIAGLAIRSVCLENGDTTTGDPPPPWPVDPTRPEPPVFPEQCQAVPVPTTESIGAWTVYHWSNLKNFFYCDLMRFLNRMHRTIVDLGVYSAALAQHYSRWTELQLIPWINGHLNNIALGQVTIISSEASGCTSLWCVIGSLFGTVDNIFSTLGGVIESAIGKVFGPLIDLLSQFLDIAGFLIIDIMGALLDVGLWLITKIFGMYDRVSGVFNTLISAWTAAPAFTHPWMPTCSSNPQGSGVCIGLWVLENTIFSGWGVALIPLIISYSSILMMIWLMEEILKTIEKAAKLI